MAQASIQGRFVWQELMTNDTAAAAAFYPKITGWQASPSPHDASYILFRTGSGPIAGLMKLAADAHGVPPHWLPYIGSDNVDTTVAAAEKLGAKVLHATTEMSGVGRFAVLADPQGAAFGVYKPNTAMPDKSTPSPGEFSWQELGTSNLEAAFEFYRELFGWQAIHRMDMGPNGTYLVFGQGSVQRGGIYKLNPAGPSRWLPYIEVPNADAAAGAARAAGARIVNGPMDVPGGGRIAQLLDPHDILIAVHSAAPTAAKSAPSAPEKKSPPKPQAAPAQPAAKPAAKSATPPSASAAKPAAAKPVAAKPAAAKAAAPKAAAPAKKAPAKKSAAKKAKKAKKKSVAKKSAKRAKKKVAPKKAKQKARGKSRARGKKKATRKK
jgi:predicted enzyme related to lactoylglutathione lyase